MKKVLTIAGSDSGGGAGIQADIKTISACGCYAASVLTAITAQNTLGVQAVETTSLKLIEQQIRAVLDDIGADAVKIGMLATPDIVELVARLLREYRPPHIVLDPVLVATSGDRLSTGSTVGAILTELMPLATVTTPNIPEAEQLSGKTIRSTADFQSVWSILKTHGAQAILLKGGHLTTKETTTDMLFTLDSAREKEEDYCFVHGRVDTKNTHGTGCSLSSAIAAYLALEHELPEAVRLATDYIHGAISAAQQQQIGHGHGPIHHFFRWWE